jgi:dynein light intermediate chain, axonemal
LEKKIRNIFLPGIQDDQLWVQYVSSTPATRPDVVNLQKNLDKALQSRQARETGICPIREELYSQCFDELIREVRENHIKYSTRNASTS